MKLICRVCPVCDSDDCEEVVALRQELFTISNPTYNQDGFEQWADPEQLYPIVKCRHCEMIYSLFHLDDETEALVYNRVIDSDISLDRVLTVPRRIKDLKRWLELLTLVNASHPGRIDLKVMDYGCGFGTLLLVAQGPGVQVIGFDVTEWKIAWARSQGLTICTSVKELEAYAPFDIVISTSVLEHLRTPRDAVAQMVSMLKPDGYALITCIVGAAARESGWNDIQRRVKRGSPLPKEINPWEHLNYFTVDTLVRFLAEFSLFPVQPETEPMTSQELVPSLKRSWKLGHSGIQVFADYIQYKRKQIFLPWYLRKPKYFQLRRA